MRCLALLLVLVLAASPARARSADAVARAEFEQATALYEAGRYDDALDAYARAYALSDAPELLFNIGQCHFAMGEHEAAIRSYRRYLEEAGSAADRALVHERIAEAQHALQRAPAPAGGDDDGTGDFVSAWWFWAGVAGAAALVTATVATGTWIAQDTRPPQMGVFAPPR